MVWGVVLLLTIPTPALPRIVSAEPLFENAEAVLAKTTLKTSQLRSVTGVGRFVPPKTIIAVPLFKGGTFASQFCGVVQLSLTPRPTQVENGEGTISPVARRTAPGGAYPVK